MNFLINNNNDSKYIVPYDKINLFNPIFIEENVLTIGKFQNFIAIWDRTQLFITVFNIKDGKIFNEIVELILPFLHSNNSELYYLIFCDLFNWENLPNYQSVYNIICDNNLIKIQTTKCLLKIQN